MQKKSWINEKSSGDDRNPISRNGCNTNRERSVEIYGSRMKSNEIKQTSIQKACASPYNNCVKRDLDIRTEERAGRGRPSEYSKETNREICPGLAPQSTTTDRVSPRFPASYFVFVGSIIFSMVLLCFFFSLQASFLAFDSVLPTGHCAVFFSVGACSARRGEREEAKEREIPKETPAKDRPLNSKGSPRWAA